ncbi:hypothetical protein BDP55DRAFT_627769 [Colletotrichum godetiae]|uniref:Uncharacterized protein n=1 Tax=Colletotrichum godetiae TaxID=1209918 RepID=A0AAJ0EXI8_9PEZI|nr:uncharacterized protein BDP55DRAFT_627769 [Colletotrichum godetiae]KAK1691104.1 hypothetical protein BDP55DRAFT_627769 [Colletotrichum godetiae]
MDASNSNLTDSRYGYDFVVSTTQASINSDLLEYLCESNQPVHHVCYLLDPKSNKATNTISLDELLKRTDRVNPFEIPDGTPADDPRVQTLTRNNFAVGVKIRIGVPPGKMPKQLPPVLELGKINGKSLFRMFCSEFQVIQNTPSDGKTSKGTWNVWVQPSGSPWYIETAVDLLNSGLDRNLESPYFNQHPELKENLKAQIDSLSANTTFSLQQTLLDLENAAMHSALDFVGIPAESHVLAILQENFVKIYTKATKNYGQPVLAVSAVSQNNSDLSQLRMTSFELGISPYKLNGVVVNNPNPQESAVTTLNYLCMTDGHGAPAVSEPYWNWILPSQLQNESGIIAIKRSVFAEQLMQTILPSAMKSCLTSKVGITFTDWWGGDWQPDLKFFPNQHPQITEVRNPDQNSWIINITWSSAGDAGIEASNSETVYSDTLRVEPHYTCEVFVDGTNIYITQHMWIIISATCEGVYQAPLNGYDFTITDTYDLSVDQTGRLNIMRDSNKHHTDDKSQSPDAGYLANAFSGVNDAVNQIKNQIQGLVSVDLQSIDFPTPQNFVFPGGKVFTYTSAKFSDHQDLVCDITYAAPTKSSQPPPQTVVPDADSSWAKAPTEIGVGTAPKHPGATSPSLHSMTHTTDLIQNYIQGEIVAPTAKFEALQTDDGHSLLFALGMDNVLQVIMEQSGTTKTGWVRENLSLPSQLVRTFDVGQSVTDGTIGMALVVSEGGADQLFLSLFNSSSDTSWTEKPTWSAIPFDVSEDMAPGHTVNILRVMFAEPEGSRQQIIVDVDRSSSNEHKNIARYYVDPQKTSGRFWSSHDVPVDIEGGQYQSCVGRVARGFVDGVYTCGSSGGSAQLVYVPIENAFGDGPPAPSRLSLPQNVGASAIAAARRPGSLASPDGTTDLFAVGDSVLYYFPAEGQTDLSVGKPLLNNKVLSGTSEMAAMTRDGVTTIWGKNANDEVFCLSCPSSQLGSPEAWSVPVPILFGVERMTPYLNRRDGGKAIFTSGSGKLERLTQATGTEAKIWVADDIKLQAGKSTAKPLQFKSYTTTIQVLDKYDLPAPGVTLSISTNSRTPVYMNGTYYVLGQAPIKVAVDATGSLTVVEALQDRINGTIMTVICNDGDAEATINPMEKSFKSIAALSSEGALRDAKVPTRTVAGGIRDNTTWAALVEGSVSQSDRANAANSLGKLGTTYGLLKPTVSSTSCLSVIPHALYASSSSVDNLAHDTAIAAGDLFRWLKSDIENVIDIIKDDASEAWHFVATISGKVYRAALTSVEAVVGAAEWIFNAVKTGIEKLTSFVEFLYSWDDIKRTKDVLCNMTKQWLRDQIDYLPTAKTEFDAQIAHAESSIRTWAGIPDLGPSLGDKASKPAAASATNPTKGHTSGSQMMMTHFKHHSANMTVVGVPPTTKKPQSGVIDDLLAALDHEEEALSAVVSQLKDLAKRFSSMTVEEILKDLLGIIAVGVLSSVKVVVDALLNVLIDLLGDAVGLLDVKIHIPVISDLLNEISIPDISYLDLVCWIPAMSFTVIYKLATQEAPFTADDVALQAGFVAGNSEVMQESAIMTTSAITSSETLKDRQQQVKGHKGQASVTSISSSDSVSAASTVPTTPGSTKPVTSKKDQLKYSLCHIAAGAMSFLAIWVTPLEVVIPAGIYNPWGNISTTMALVSTAALSTADSYAPKDPIQDEDLASLSDLITAIGLANIIVFSDIGQEHIIPAGNALRVNDPRATAAYVDSILVFPAAAITAVHLSELASAKLSADQAAAFLGELANMTSYVVRTNYFVAVKSPGTPAAAQAVEDMEDGNIYQTGFEAAQAAIGIGQAIFQ